MNRAGTILNKVEEHETLYRTTLAEYCRTHSEEALYQASLLSSSLIQKGLGPDEIVALHYEGMQAVAQDETLPHSERIRILNDAHQFLLEVMIAYGAQYKEFLDLRLAEAIRRAEDAELGERQKLEMLAMIAHELGNPLTVALGNMQLAVRFLDARDIKNVRDLVSDSREALERLAGLTSQLVAASRGDGQELKREPVDLRRVVRRAHNLASRLAQTKSLTLEVESASEPVIVTGDEEALVTILNNLVSNGIRYTRPGGHVTIFLECSARGAVLGVSDTGIGMSADVQARLFEKFYRGTEARELEPKGMGMGLSIVQRLVPAHGGEIEVESEPGRGSTFRVVLPLTERHEESDGT